MSYFLGRHLLEREPLPMAQDRTGGSSLLLNDFMNRKYRTKRRVSMRRLFCFIVSTGLLVMLTMLASEAFASCYRCTYPGGIPTCWLANGTNVNCGLNNGRCYVWGTSCGSGVIVPEYPHIDSSTKKQCSNPVEYGETAQQISKEVLASEASESGAAS